MSDVPTLPLDPTNFTYHKVLVAVRIFDEKDPDSARDWVEKVKQNLGNNPDHGAGIKDLEAFMEVAILFYRDSKSEEARQSWAQRMMALMNQDSRPHNLG